MDTRKTKYILNTIPQQRNKISLNSEITVNNFNVDEFKEYQSNYRKTLMAFSKEGIIEIRRMLKELDIKINDTDTVYKCLILKRKEIYLWIKQNIDKKKQSIIYRALPGLTKDSLYHNNVHLGESDIAEITRYYSQNKNKGSKRYCTNKITQYQSIGLIKDFLNQPKLSIDGYIPRRKYLSLINNNIRYNTSVPVVLDIDKELMLGRILVGNIDILVDIDMIIDNSNLGDDRYLSRIVFIKRSGLVKTSPISIEVPVFSGLALSQGLEIEINDNSWKQIDTDTNSIIEWLDMSGNFSKLLDQMEDGL